ncbi:MotA/TolQ/ExbB proton channel family protein, partial [Ilyobacter sp.]
LLLQCTKNKDCNIVHMEEKAREVGLAQLPRLERGMWLLGIVAHTTPLLGLLGTVTGMIQAFHAIASYGTGDPSVLAEGISKALITTAGGLTVAIPAVIFYNYFNKRIDTVINNMEKSSVEMINFFRK